MSAAKHNYIMGDVYIFTDEAHSNPCNYFRGGELVEIRVSDTYPRYRGMGDKAGVLCSGHAMHLRPTGVELALKEEVNLNESEKSMGITTTNELVDLDLSKEDRVLREHGVIDTSGRITIDGQALLAQSLLKLHKSELVDTLEKVAAAAKKAVKAV